VSEAKSTELVMKLLGFCSAYPEDIFPPLTKAERAGLPSGVIDRASAAMGRHLAKFAKEAADALEAQHKEIERLRAQVATEYCRGRDHEARARADASKPIEPTRSRMSVIAQFIRNQVSLADRPPPGCIQLNNDEALLCAEALERVTGDVGEKRE
jgi:hypothetical protein